MFSFFLQEFLQGFFLKHFPFPTFSYNEAMSYKKNPLFKRTVQDYRQSLHIFSQAKYPASAFTPLLTLLAQDGPHGPGFSAPYLKDIPMRPSGYPESLQDFLSLRISKVLDAVLDSKDTHPPEFTDEFLILKTFLDAENILLHDLCSPTGRTVWLEAAISHAPFRAAQKLLSLGSPFQQTSDKMGWHIGNYLSLRSQQNKVPTPYNQEDPDFLHFLATACPDFWEEASLASPPWSNFDAHKTPLLQEMLKNMRVRRTLSPLAEKPGSARALKI